MSGKPDFQSPLEPDATNLPLHSPTTSKSIGVNSSNSSGQAF
jgi:hypothetical protein